MTSETTQSRALAREGPLDGRHIQSGADFSIVDGAPIVVRFPFAVDTTVCGLADLSALPRIGFKGWHVWAVLVENGVQCPSLNNTACEVSTGGLCLRLGDNEAFILSNPRGHIGDRFAPMYLNPTQGCYPAPRRETHAWLLITGSAAPEVLSKVCAVDCRLHRFPQFAIAQTIAAAVSIVLVRHDLGLVPAFHLLVDTTSAGYLWAALLDAGQQFGVAPVGLDTLHRVGSSSSM